MDYGQRGDIPDHASWSAQKIQIDLLREIRNLLVEIKDLLDTDTV